MLYQCQTICRIRQDVEPAKTCCIICNERDTCRHVCESGQQVSEFATFEEARQFCNMVILVDAPDGGIPSDEVQVQGDITL